MGLKIALSWLLLVGLESQAMAHEEPAPLSTKPIDWLLPGLAYVLPGIILAIILNEYASKIGLFSRTVCAIIFPLFLWIAIAHFVWGTDRSVLDTILAVPWLIFSESFLLLFVPSGVIIAVSGLLDFRRRQKAESSETFAEI